MNKAIAPTTAPAIRAKTPIIGHHPAYAAIPAKKLPLPNKLIKPVTAGIIVVKVVNDAKKKRGMKALKQLDQLARQQEQDTAIG